MRVSCNGVKTDGMKNEQPAPLDFHDQIQRGAHVVIGFPGAPMMSVIAGTSCGD
jgi:hypothetical protein